MKLTNRNLQGSVGVKKLAKRKIVLVVLLTLIVMCIGYNVYDNQRVVIKNQSVILNDLPEVFDGYRILQISDLHGKYFGNNQKELLSIINKLDYDAVVFTGDMNKYEDNEIESTQAVLDLINGIENKSTALWVDGNTGPFAIETIDGSCTGKLTDIGKNIEQTGVKILLSPIEITKGNESIWVVPELCQSDIQMNYLSLSEDMIDDKKDFQSILSYGQSLQEWYNQLNNNQQTKIRINHFPIQANMKRNDWDSLGYIDYSLSISGHYHGGQIRIPLIGALYIPSPTSGIMNGYFPKQNEVQGLNKILDMQQYISAGLGSSASISFFDFRLFDTPEINLITLYCQK